jgi:activating signal cointegrator 1
MKALSLWAPWGSLMADGRKKIETRSWRPPAWLIGQPVAIHQTMRVDKDACEDFGYDALTIPRGCVVAIGEFSLWMKFDKDYKASLTVACQLAGNEEWRFGDFEMGRYGWFFTLTEKLNPPLEAKGMQGLWDWERPA